MSVVLPLPQTASAPVLCAHCGYPVPAGLVQAGDAAQFCCSGCRQVHTLVREWGFDQYYQLINQQRGTLEPATVTGRSFDDFDDERAQRDATVTVGPGRRRTRLYLEGVHCAACVWLVEKLPAVLPGVDEVRLNFGTGIVDVTWHPSDTRLSAISRAFDRLGYTPHLQGLGRGADQPRNEDRAMLARLGVATACAMNLMFVSGALYAGEASGMAPAYVAFFRWFSLVISVPVLGYAARPFFQTAIAGLRLGLVHIDLPIAIALVVAAGASAANTVAGHGPLWFDSLAMLVAALLAARVLQRGAQRVALERADSLRGAAFLEFARRLDGDGPDAPVVEVPLTALSAGDRVEVRSGDLVPVDGVILSGRSSLNNAVLTGEAQPQAVREGDAVCAGATNLGARLLVRVDAAGEHTRVGALLVIVQDALSRKAALVRTTDRLARIFVLVVLAAAVVTGALAWASVGPVPAMQRVVALLVVSCPCALGMAVPLAMSVALLRAAQAGMFIKDPDVFERLRRIETVLLDKTGTLTEGRATVARWHGEPAAFELARSLEAESAHAVARAFQESSGRSLRVVRTIEGVSEVPGHGIAGRVDGHDVRVGTRAHVVPSGETLPEPEERAVAAMVTDGLSPVFVAVDGRLAGVAGIGDATRSHALETLNTLRARGIHVRILSGDHPDIVSKLGAELGVAAADAIGGLSPEAKRDHVAALLARPGRNGAVVMVGDGVNDAAALALADVGIAVHGGTGASMLAADVVLARDGVAPLLELFDGARRLRGVIRRNIAFSIAYNAIASSLAVAGLVGPLLAVLLMPISSLTVVFSSAVTRTFTRRRPVRAGI